MKEEIQAICNVLSFGNDITFGDLILKKEDEDLFVVSNSDENEVFGEFNSPEKAAQYFVKSLYDLKYKW